MSARQATFALVSDAVAKQTANDAIGPELDSPTARAFTDAELEARAQINALAERRTLTARAESLGGSGSKKSRRRAKKDTAAAIALADAASFLGLTCEAGRAANAAREAAPVELEPAGAFPVMLPDRSWGASVEGNAAKGARIRITTRGGKSWVATVMEVHFVRGGRTIVSAQGDDPPEARTSSPRGGRRRGGGRSYHASIGGRDYFQNARGRCEDAPCCGCCS